MGTSSRFLFFTDSSLNDSLTKQNPVLKSLRQPLCLQKNPHAHKLHLNPERLSDWFIFLSGAEELWATEWFVRLRLSFIAGYRKLHRVETI